MPTFRFIRSIPDYYSNFLYSINFREPDHLRLFFKVSYTNNKTIPYIFEKAQMIYELKCLGFS